ncbi:MAG: helix-turn-helix transcriptional regulator [Ruminococcus sp.]|nr:helix-turn-helix transcriptional regulator [Ruminococcus sp.]
MNSNELGRRIKEARLAKKLTQAEVVGDFITRNMLSQIESGAALPSVKTLEYLSRVLEVPMAQLMPEEEPSADGAADYMSARALFNKEDYARVADLPDIPGFSDELTALRARACLELARRADSKDIGALQKAAELARQAVQLSDKGLFANASVRSEALLLLNTLAGQLSDYYKSMIDSELDSVKL